MSEKVKNINDSDFKKLVLEAAHPTALDFWAPWCPPCKALAPILDELQDEYSGRLEIFKINVDENPVTPSQYNVQGLPTLLVFKDGEVFEQIIGLVPKEQLSAAFDKVTS